MFCKLDLCLTLGLIVLAWTMLDLAWGQLIRPVYIYGGLIKSIRNYFNNTCIILLHNPNPIETQGENNVEAEYCEYSIEMTDAIGRSYIENSLCRTRKRRLGGSPEIPEHESLYTHGFHGFSYVPHTSERLKRKAILFQSVLFNC